jgi:glycine cleavage system H lipoate-binding protein
MIMMSMVLLTFLAGALADYVLTRVLGWVPEPTTLVLAPATGEPLGRYIEGFLVPEGLRYHAGHTWARREGGQTARVGANEFAAKLAGNIDKIELPKPGEWLRQGQPVVKVYRNGEMATLLCPVEGEVVEVNADVRNDPSLLRRDSYGKGWLMTLHVYDEVSTWRNLLPVNLVRGWMKEAVSRLYAKQPSLVAVAADGGRPVDDLLAALPGAGWAKTTEEFFLP